MTEKQVKYRKLVLAVSYSSWQDWEEDHLSLGFWVMEQKMYCCSML